MCTCIQEHTVCSACGSLRLLLGCLPVSFHLVSWTRSFRWAHQFGCLPVCLLHEGHRVLGNLNTSSRILRQARYLLSHLLRHFKIQAFIKIIKCVGVFAPVHTCVGVLISVCTCTQRPEVTLRRLLCHLPVRFWDRVYQFLPYTHGLCEASWPGSPNSSPVSTSLALGSWAGSATPSCSGDQTQALMLTWQALCQWSHLPICSQHSQGGKWTYSRQQLPSVEKSSQGTKPPPGEPLPGCQHDWLQDLLAPGWALTWVPGPSPRSHQGREENKNILWFCQLKIAPDIPVLCGESIHHCAFIQVTEVLIRLQIEQGFM